jgi:TM2 domain-containing membrane protein YozV
MKSKMVTMALCLFVGFLGAHRFYLGKIGSGVAQLLTFGGLGIWWAIDLIMIALGKMTDSEGRALA